MGLFARFFVFSIPAPSRQRRERRMASGTGAADRQARRGGCPAVWEAIAMADLAGAGRHRHAIG